ncbi:hypothetical protein D0469_02480 [Peribacillus saganii]|uniref:Uncharacterized protein n=1 Tax=Peribacillus saganii TaxID=2303992 RepID=A0A372LST6_9BACI|nr:hypothetical protein D0469_02480 [Peribacillus saganii]
MAGVNPVLNWTHASQFLFYTLVIIMFEATSAFGTVGLSMGLTPELSPIGRIIIIFTMFSGRLGPLTVAFAVAMKRKPDAVRHPKGKIMIG